MDNIKEKIKRIIYQELKQLASNEALTLSKLQARFYIITKESLNNYLDKFKEIINELEKLGYIRFENFRIGRIIKGINFDNWVKLVEAENSTISIGSINASQVQVGTHNVMTINSIPPEDLLNILELLVNNPEKKGENIISKLKESLSLGFSTSELIIKMYEIGKNFF